MRRALYRTEHRIGEAKRADLSRTPMDETCHLGLWPKGGIEASRVPRHIWIILAIEAAILAGVLVLVWRHW